MIRSSVIPENSIMKFDPLFVKLAALPIILISTVAVIDYEVATSIYAQKKDGTTINVAGRQRMLNQRFFKELLLATSSDSLEERAGLLDKADKTRQLFDDTLQVLKSGGSLPINPAENITQAFSGVNDEELRNTLAEKEKIAKKRDQEASRLLRMLETSNKPLDFSALDSIISELHVAANRAVQQFVEQSESKIYRMEVRVFWISIVAIILGSLLSFLIGSSIIRSIRNTSKAIRGFAQGDLTTRLGSGESGEFLKLSKDFDNTMDALENALGDESVDWSYDFSAARKSLSRIQSMVHGAPSAIIMLDPEGHIGYTNPAATRMLNAYHSCFGETDELEGRSVATIFLQDGESVLAKAIDKSELPYNTVMACADEYLSLDIAPITSEQGDYLGPMLTIRIVTESAVLEKQVAEKQEQEKKDALALQKDVDHLLNAVNAASAGDLRQTLPNSSNSAMKQISDGLDKLFGSLRTSFANILQHATTVASASEQLSGFGGQMGSQAKKTSSEATHVAEAANDVNHNVQNVAAATHQMTTTVNGIAEHAVKASETAATAVTLTEKTDSTVRRLSQSSSGIGNILKVITSIAEQTNLLALNATIEAARAGDAGKGFAVVANEVKELAKATAEATEEISQRIGAIQSDSEDAARAISEIGEITGKIHHSQELISDSVEEQKSVTSEINRSITEVAETIASIASSIDTVSSGATETLEGTDGMGKAAEELARLGVELQTETSRFEIS